MLIITSQIVLLLATIIMPLKSKKGRIKTRRYKIDTDTSNASYAINEFGSLEFINKINTTGPSSEIEN